MLGSGTCQQWNVGGSRVDVYVVSGRWDVRSSDPQVRFRAEHVSMLSMCHDGGERGTYSGCSGRTFSCIYYLSLLLLSDHYGSLPR